VDTLESFVTIRAGIAQVWPFVTQVAKIAMWAAPFAEPIAGQEATQQGVLDAGDSFDLVFGLPGHPTLHCVVLSLRDEAVEVKFDGFVRGLATWHIVPADKGVIAHCRVKYGLAQRHWLPLWALVGRWGAALGLNLLLRRLRARIEDVVGSSRFGVPLLVSPYAVVGVAAVVGACLGFVGLRIARWLWPEAEKDG